MPLSAVQPTLSDSMPAVAVTPVTWPGLVTKSASFEALVSSLEQLVSL